MQRRLKVELFEQIRREYEFGSGSIRAVARKFGVHRRMVRQALASAVPPARKTPVRLHPQFDQVRDFINAVLESDRRAPRKQRHTAHRIYVRLLKEVPDCAVAERTVRHCVRVRKLELGLLGRETFVPQSYAWGEEAQVDWYEAVAELAGERQTVQVFTMRSMASGAAFHRSYPRPTQQAFFEAHELGFRYFGGVFHRLRYDNLTSAVKKILRGHQREQNERFIAFRSHWQFAAEFCTPARGHEKGGVEGEAGYFRRNHWVPVPQAADFENLNDYLRQECERDWERRVGTREMTVGQAMQQERVHLLPLPGESFELAEESFHTVDTKGCVQVRTNWYSVPLRAGTKVRVRVLPTAVEVWHEGQCVARHERCYQRRQQRLDLEHYLDVLERKPGALKGSTPLAQWRASGRWPASYDQLWQSLEQRHGKQAGTRQMIELVQEGRRLGYERLTQAVEQALTLGVTDAAAVRYLLTAETLVQVPAPIIGVGALARYQRPLPTLHSYDELLGQEVAR